ncbi:MAG: DNA mismatch repair endonuclease MutL [Saprospiraceae bacterium]|nr:DNA mismatch repair endonuclease MutL [Saprospiraceae bacterium]MCB0542344.1 DNA mismatch repair endonuclease MutL [Saprospiraceae bacterium]MCB0572946.1 DNA mismatch repair endonuclease MutL [Saprospiraceae bacterium]MCB9353275.1 DNA mismatch repair endonuclease MutL [Lewinellaceae bacterium]
MTDVIQLLPENVANQIAAGEVVQRPSSVVKELLENAIDAGASQVKLVVREAGKALVQVIDNGCGMSETDARMSFERHATSKIRESKDLFAIRTMGFRGEALASIAAVAQVELRTRRANEELGTRITVESSTVKMQEPCQCAAGTSIAVRNLFYNVPARRNFLKSDPVEMRHVLDEFQRVAIANPDVFFSLHHNDQEIFHLPPGNLRQRVVKIFGDHVNKKLVPVQEETDILKITGLVGKPDFFKKSRGEQLFFVNKRFIKSNYLHHAVVQAYEDLLPPDTFPFYVLFLDIDPMRIDINVHPTKQEIKFDDEKLVYNYLKVTVRHALGSHNVTPTLDFEQEPAFQAVPTKAPFLSQRPERPPSVGDFRPSPAGEKRHEDNLRHWQRLYEGLDLVEKSGSEPGEAEPTINFEVRPSAGHTQLDDESGSFSKGQKEPYQIHGQYIVSHIKSGFLLIDQQAASERILYERYLEALGNQPIATQKMLFPKNIELATADAALLKEILEEVNKLGFDIAEFGGNAFVVHGTPADLSGVSEEALLEKVLSQYKDNLELELGTQDNLARAMARSAAAKRGQALTVPEMQDLIDQLFACSVPYSSPSGRNCFITFELTELQKRFGNQA